MEQTTKYFEFITEFTHDGKKKGSEIFAESWDEAREILKSKRLTEKLVGFVSDVEYEMD